MLKDSLAVHELLSHESSGRQHGKTSVLELLGLHREEFFRIFGLQAKGVEVKVSRDVGVTEKTRLGDRDVLGLDPSNGGTLLLSSTNGDGQKDPEEGRNLSQVGDGRSRNLRIEKERRSLNLLTNQESQSGKHGHTSVGQLSLTVSLECGPIGLLSEAQRVEKTDRGEGSRNTVNGEGLEGSGLVVVVVADRSKGSGRAGKGKESGSELHDER